MKIKHNSHVTIRYTGMLKDGTILDSTIGTDPLEFTLGENKILPGFEKQLIGLKKGDKRTLFVKSEDAYGSWSESELKEISRKEFPEGLPIEEGMDLAVQADSETIPIKVHKVYADRIIVDYNHPLVDKDLTFEVEILDVQKSGTAFPDNKTNTEEGHNPFILPAGNFANIFKEETESLPDDITKYLSIVKEPMDLFYTNLSYEYGNIIGITLSPKIIINKSGVPVPDFRNLTINVFMSYMYFFKKELVEEAITRSMGKASRVIEDGDISFVKANLIDFDRLIKEIHGLSKQERAILSSSVIFKDNSGLLAAFKYIEMLIPMVLGKFDNYILKVYLSGNFKEAPERKISSVFVFDDSDARNMGRKNLKSGIKEIIYSLSEDLDNVLPYQFEKDFRISLLSDDEKFEGKLLFFRNR